MVKFQKHRLQSQTAWVPVLILLLTPSKLCVLDQSTYLLGLSFFIFKVVESYLKIKSVYF